MKWRRSVVSDSLRPHRLQPTTGFSVHGIFQARVPEWVAVTTTNIIIMKKLEMLWELPKWDTETWSKQILLENGTNQLTWCRVATDTQIGKNKTKQKPQCLWSTVKQNMVKQDVPVIKAPKCLLPFLFWLCVLHLCSYLKHNSFSMFLSNRSC